MNGLPFLSVGLPTYNRPEGLEKVIQYLIKQDYKHLEIIISDNCSPNPKVKEILEHYAKLDSRIRYFIQAKNIEIEPNFNFVYHQAKGDYFMWIADDDEFPMNYFSACIDFLEKNKDYILCSGLASYYANKQLLFSDKEINLPSQSALIRLMKYLIQVNKNGVFYGVYRNHVAFDNPIQKHIGADWNHIARIALIGKIKTLNHVQSKRSDEGGSSSRSKIAARWGISSMKKVFMETYIAYEVAYYLFNESILKKKFIYPVRVAIQLLVFLFLNAKFLYNSIRKRLK